MKNSQKGNTEKKEWLLRYSELIDQIERESEAASFWRDKSYSLSSVSYQNLGIRSSNPTAATDCVLRYYEIADMCTELANQAIVAKDEIELAISRVKNKEQRRVLRLHYIDGKPFEDVADKLDFSINWVWQLHRKGLDNLEIPSPS